MYTNWWWTFDRQIVNTSASITTGTIAATNGSTTVTFSSAPAVSVAGRKLFITSNSDDPAGFRIASHTAAATTATLDAAYTGTTVTASDFAIYHDEIDLAADTGEIKSILRAGRHGTLREIGPSAMDARKSTGVRVGPPENYCVRNFSTSGDPTTVRKLVVDPFPDTTIRLEIGYYQTLNTEVSGSTRFLLPDDNVDVLLHMTLADGYPIFLNDSIRGAQEGKKADAILTRLIAQQRRYDDAPAIQPAMAGYRGFYRSARRVSSATADLGSYFDRWDGR